MYEIWLTLNILWELGMTILPWLIAGAVIWVLLMLPALRRSRADWGRNFKLAFWLALAFGIFIFAVTPAWTKASFSDMGYWIDWGNLLMIGVAWAAGAFAFLWPLLTLVRGRGQAHA